jgi:predicted DNA-binding transcriptional regulator YafY
VRADRLVTILLLLQTYRRLTARQLSERLEVSERTIHRDMEALSVSGIPLVAARGAGGGWTLPGSYRTDLTGLRQDEVQALFLTGPPRVLSDLGLHAALDGALVKLMAALPVQHRRDADFIRQRIYIDSAPWRPAEERAAVLPLLREALWRDRRLVISYQRSDSVLVDRLVDPLGLVAKSGLWYLVAAVDGEIRTYRVSRIDAAHLADEACVRPSAFDLAGFWTQSSAQFIAGLPRYPAQVRVTGEVVPRLRFGGRFARIEQVNPPDADGWSRVDIRFETIDEACEFCLGFGPGLEVLEPLELRERVIRLARETVEFYAKM